MDKEKIILFAEPEETISLELHPLLVDKGNKLIVARTLKETLLTLQDQMPSCSTPPS